MTPSPFHVTVDGSFYAMELYDSRGREVFTLADAIEAADDNYGATWREVYNGSEGAHNSNNPDLKEG